MIRAVACVAALVLAACEPPPEIVGGGGDPSIRIIYPPGDIGTIPLDTEGRLRFLTVVDIDGLEFVPPSVSQGTPVDGEGHYHFHLNGSYLGPPEAEYREYLSEQNEFSVGTQMSVRVTLASNDHIDLDDFEEWEDVVEFEVAAAPTR